MRYFIPGTALAFLAHATSAASGTPLHELLEHGRIALHPIGLGGHSGECLRVDVKNLTSAAVTTAIPAGWVFVSEDPMEQDLIVVREEVIALAPNGRGTVTCRAFCTEASKSAPGKDALFRKGHPAPEKLTILARYVDSLAFEDDLVGAAVWVLSDGHDIASMGALDSTKNDVLRELISTLSGQPAPRYTLRYAEDDRMACSGRPSTITRTLRFNNAAPQRLTVLVRSDNGRTHHVLHSGTPLVSGSSVINLALDVQGWPVGRYAFHVFTTEAEGVRRLPFHL
ncbi:MAG: hypothetical protein JNM91_14405 [Flavobacteriales bacterium]|nr:hypothetical protein [Flavobacteriales bacterium]